MEEVTPTRVTRAELEKLIDDLANQVDDHEKSAEELKKKEASRVQQLQAHGQQIQQQLQQVTAAAINTMGQIKQLEAVLEEQKRERHQLEGAVRTIMAQQQPSR
jgi:predicted  nucleic acid-binding Zn-ribbon protein